jgi:hypothetical protein
MKTKDFYISTIPDYIGLMPTRTITPNLSGDIIKIFRCESCNCIKLNLKRFDGFALCEECATINNIVYYSKQQTIKDIIE